MFFNDILFTLEFENHWRSPLTKWILVGFPNWWLSQWRGQIMLIPDLRNTVLAVSGIPASDSVLFLTRIPGFLQSIWLTLNKLICEIIANIFHLVGLNQWLPTWGVYKETWKISRWLLMAMLLPNILAYLPRAMQYVCCFVWTFHQSYDKP